MITPPRAVAAVLVAPAFPLRRPDGRAWTPAQQRVLLCCAGALTYREMAARLGCSARTAKAHVHAIAVVIPRGHPDPYVRAVAWAVPRLAPVVLDAA